MYHENHWRIGEKINKIPIVMNMTLPCHFLVFPIFHPNNKQQTTFPGAKKPNKEMMDAATRGITKAGTSENTMRVRVDDDFLHQELLDLNETIRDYHRLTMYFPNRTRPSLWEWYGKCLGMGVHIVVQLDHEPPRFSKQSFPLPPPMGVCYWYCSWWSFPNIRACLEYTNNI